MSKSPDQASVSQQAGITYTFSVTLNQEAASKWFLDGAEQAETSLTYTKAWSSQDMGLHNITYVGTADETASTTWMVTVAALADNAPEPSLLSPMPSVLLNVASVTFSCYATDDIGLASMTLYGNWSGWGAKNAVSLSGKNATATFTETLPEGENFWNCMAQDSGGNSGFAADNYTLLIDLAGSSSPDNGTPPEVLSHPPYSRIIQWPNSIKISPGNSEEFQITVKNTGEGRIEELYLESADRWLDTDMSKFALDAGETKVLSANLSVPLIAAPSPYSVSIFLKSPERDFDDIVIPVLVIEKPGSSSTSTIDIDAVKQEIEQVKIRMDNLSVHGYDTTIAKGHVDSAESMFDDKEYLNASEQVSLANIALDASESTRETTRTFLKSYVIAGIGVSVAVILLYLLYKKYSAEKTGIPAGAPGVTGARITPVPPMQQRNVNVDDMIRRLREIKKHAGK